MVDESHFKTDKITYFHRGRDTFLGIECPVCGGVADYSLGRGLNIIADIDDEINFRCLGCDENTKVSVGEIDISVKTDEER